MKVGAVFKNVRVEKKIYGSSFLVRLDKTTSGFLHKSHIKEWEQKDESEDEEVKNKSHPKDKKKKSRKVNKVQNDDDSLLKVG